MMNEELRPIAMLVGIIGGIAVGGLTGFVFAVAGWPGAGSVGGVLGLVAGIFIYKKITGQGF